MKTLKIGLVGCGAVTEYRHLPALLRREDCQVTAVVDQNVARAARLAGGAAVPNVLTDYHDLPSLGIDAAIVALPNYLHAPASVELLRAGIHVLVEKPMALSVAECDAMLQAAEAGHAVLSVGLARRFLHAGQFAKWAIERGLLGRLLSFDIRDGNTFNWPLASDFFFRKAAAGGGVLIDTGVHTLDQLLWWMGDVHSFEYYDDNYGGVEGECELHIKLKSGIQGIVELSRIRTLRNSAIIRGERAELEVGLWQNLISLRFSDGPMKIVGRGTPEEQPAASKESQASIIDVIAAEHEDLFAAIRTGGPPTVSGAEGRKSIALIEACYVERRALIRPWVAHGPALLDKVSHVA